jgi:acyl carrier protein
VDNKSKYDQIFVNAFGIEKNMLSDDLAYQSIEAWDSVGHMSLIGELEEEFNIIMDIDDIIEFSSYAVGVAILSKYGVEM